MSQLVLWALSRGLTTSFDCRTTVQRLAAAHCTSAEHFTGQLAADDCVEQTEAAGKAIQSKQQNNCLELCLLMTV